MIFISLSRNDFHMTWVAYAHGRVIGRETRYYDEKSSLQSIIDLSSYLQEAFKVVKSYLDTPEVPYDLSDTITIELGSKKLYQWLSERNFASTYTETATDCLSLFDELSLPVKVILNKNVSKLWADKYNSSKFITDNKLDVVSALDWVSSLG